MEMRHADAPYDQISGFEDELGLLPDVRAARVVAAQGRITEVHLVAEGGKSPKQLVRDVQTIAQAKFGLEIDYRTVSVVQFGAQPIPIAPAKRPALSSLGWETQHTKTTCRVTLEAGQETVVGEAEGAASSVGRSRLVARAAIEAIALLEGRGPRIDVSDLRIVEVAGQRIAITVLILLSGMGDESILVGSALVRGDESDAVARSILDAYNRQIEFTGQTGD